MERFREILGALAALMLVAHRAVVLWRDYKRARKERSHKKRG